MAANPCAQALPTDGAAPVAFRNPCPTRYTSPMCTTSGEVAVHRSVPYCWLLVAYGALLRSVQSPKAVPSYLFSSRIRGVMSGLVSTLGVKDGDTTCSMKMLALKKHTATPSGRRLLGTCDHTPGTGGNVGYRAVSQVTHMVFVTSSKRVPSARRQNTNDIVWRYGRQRLR